MCILHRAILGGLGLSDAGLFFVFAYRDELMLALLCVLAAVAMTLMLLARQTA